MHARNPVRTILLALSLGVALAAFGTLGLGLGAGDTTERVSVAGDGQEANGASEAAAVSANGRFVAFASLATNLTADLVDGARDIFIHDRSTGTTELVSVGSAGGDANDHAFWPAVSGDGRYVAYYSAADNLVPNDTNDAIDVFVRDRQAGTTVRASVGSSGQQGNDDSLTPSMSANGRFVTFTSRADTLIAGDSNGAPDVFLHDLVTGSTELVSVSSDGTQGNFVSGGFGAGPAEVSADGRYVVFGSFASNLVADDGNGFDDIFLRDRQAGTTVRVSLGEAGGEGDNHSMFGSVSDDGRYVAFTSQAENLTSDDGNGLGDVFVRDRLTETTVRISAPPGAGQLDGASGFPSMSGDGISVVFHSDASNLVAGDGNGSADVFLYDTVTEAVERVSIASDGSEGSGASAFGAVSREGSVIAFESAAADLVAGDENGEPDVFVRSRELPSPETATAAATATLVSPTNVDPTPIATTPVTAPTLALPETGAGPDSSESQTFVLWAASLLAGGALAGLAFAALRARSRSR